jgi:DNA-binding CsgD family transcriptional regulator
MAIVRRAAMRSSSTQRLTAPPTYWGALHKPIGSAASFSPREREIARMFAKGYPNKTIADVLEISPWTVSTHLRRIFAKLRVSSRAAMATRLISDGIVKDFT